MRVSRGKLIFDAVIGVVVLALFVNMLIECGRSETVVCERETGRPRCTVVAGRLASSTTTVYDDVVGVRAVEHENVRGQTWYDIALKDRAGREHAVADSIDPDDAKRVETWFVEREPRVEVAREAYSDRLLIASVILGAGLLLLAWSVISRLREPRAEGTAE